MGQVKYQDVGKFAKLYRTVSVMVFRFGLGFFFCFVFWVLGLFFLGVDGGVFLSI